MRVLLGALALLSLAGCWTSPITAEKADPIPAQRQYWVSSPSPSKLIVTRDTGLFGVGCNHRFYIDGVLAAEFASGEVGVFAVDPGRHILSVKPSASCGGGAVTEREVEVGQNSLVRRRLSVTPGGIDISPTGF